MEALRDTTLQAERLHLANSNRRDGIIEQITALASSRQLPIQYHERAALARISRNGRQDQGVALDIRCPAFADIDHLETMHVSPATRLLALDGITNPQNAGMITRCAVAARFDGLLWPRSGVAALGPLVIKASAGTLFRAPLIQCQRLSEALAICHRRGFAIATLRADGDANLFNYRQDRCTVYVLGGETDGVSDATRRLADVGLTIPMYNGVESLNVAVTAGILGYATMANTTTNEP